MNHWPVPGQHGPRVSWRLGRQLTHAHPPIEARLLMFFELFAFHFLLEVWSGGTSALSLSYFLIFLFFYFFKFKYQYQLITMTTAADQNYYNTPPLVIFREFLETPSPLDVVGFQRQ